MRPDHEKDRKDALLGLRLSGEPDKDAMQVGGFLQILDAAGEGAAYTASYKQLSEQCGWPVSRVTSAVKLAEKYGLVDAPQNGGKGRVYQIVWQRVLEDQPVEPGTAWLAEQTSREISREAFKESNRRSLQDRERTARTHQNLLDSVKPSQIAIHHQGPIAKYLAATGLSREVFNEALKMRKENAVTLFAAEVNFQAIADVERRLSAIESAMHRDSNTDADDF